MLPIKGLANRCPISARCKRCDLNLNGSLWKDFKVIFCVGIKRYYCVDCAIRINKNRKALTTIQDLDNFVNSLRQMGVIQ